MGFAQPFDAHTMVSAAVSVVFPWSTCPMVPTFTWGFFRSNFSLAICFPLHSVHVRNFTRTDDCSQPSLGFRQDLLRYMRRHWAVKSKLHRERRAPLGARAKIRRVSKHGRERNLRPDDLDAGAGLH